MLYSDVTWHCSALGGVCQPPMESRSPCPTFYIVNVKHASFYLKFLWCFIFKDIIIMDVKDLQSLQAVTAELFFVYKSTDI